MSDVIEVDFKNKKKIFKFTYEKSIAYQKLDKLNQAIIDFEIVCSQLGFQPGMDQHIIRCCNSMVAGFRKLYNLDEER